MTLCNFSWLHLHRFSKIMGEQLSKCYGSYFFPPISMLVISVPSFLHRDWSLNKPSYKSVTFCDWLWHHGSVSQTLYNLSLTRASLRTVLPWSYGRTQGDYYFTMASFEYDGTSRLLGCSLTLLLFIPTVIHVWHWNLTSSLHCCQ